MEKPSPAPPSSPLARFSLPTGLVTFVLTDIEGSTRLARRLEGEWPAVLTEHARVLEEACLPHDGILFETVGDSLLFVFSRPTEAVRGALDAQRALAGRSWPHGVDVRVRMGVHTGEVTRTTNRYFGLALHQVARISSVAHGGQIVLSSTTRELVADQLPPGAGIREVGSYRLKDFDDPQRLYQLTHRSLPSDFPELRAPRYVPTNLPGDRTSFIGREQEIADIRRLLQEQRLVTLLGTGGVGKTRLAIQVGSGLLEAYRDGVWMVDLAPLTDPLLVPYRLASVLGVREELGRPMQDSIAEACADKQMLVLLDNCEHLIGSCAVLADRLLATSLAVTMLATSRQALGIGGERIWPVPPLSVPGSGRDPSPEDVGRFDGLALFLDRATLADPSFTVGQADLGHVAEICRRLDGIPLAIELAAVRVAVLAPGQIAARLEDRFRLLTGGASTAPDRHQTLRAVIDWSHGMLSAPERVLLRRVAVFPGGFTLEAAEEVCSGESVEREEVLDLLDQLLRKSLIAVRRGEERAPRYVLNETTRSYGVEKLAEAGEQPALRDREREWAVGFVGEAKKHVSGPEQGRWLDAMSVEIDNLRTALEWSMATAPEAALTLASGLLRYWMVRGSWWEGQRWLQASLDVAPHADPSLRIKAFDAAGVLADLVSEYDRARGYHEEQLALARAIGDRRAIGEALQGIGWSLLRRGDMVNSQPVVREAVEVWRDLGDKKGLADAMMAQAFATPDMAEARGLAEEALALTREAGDREALAGMQMRVGIFAMLQGDYEAARSAYERALEIARDLGYRRYVARCIHELGETALLEGDLPTARRLLEEALELWPAVGHRNAVAQALYTLGEIARLEGDQDAAQETLDDALARTRDLGMEDDEATVLNLLGTLARQRGDLESAESLYRQALAIGARLSSPLPIAPSIEGLAGAAAVRGDASAAVRLFGAAQAIREAMSAPLPPVYRASHEADVSVARRLLDGDRFRAEWAEGRAAPLEDVLVSQGVTGVASAGGPAVPAPTTRRETIIPDPRFPTTWVL